jgi:hypothetical protein
VIEYSHQEVLRSIATEQDQLGPEEASRNCEGRIFIPGLDAEQVAT